jgi:hypothetical protein
MREPLNTDLHLPVVLGREEAAQRLLSLLPAETADVVWDELIAPLYDARSMSVRWRRGQCLRCNAPHPESEFARTKKRLGHLMYCPLYVGPLEHHYAGGRQAFAGWRRTCSCGQSWLEYVDGEHRETCPDAAVDWRGPRPDASCSGVGEETVPNNQETT